jgi:type II secretory pathway pseudopilin PulG
MMILMPAVIIYLLALNNMPSNPQLIVRKNYFQSPLIAFTLLELLIAIGIILLLSGMIIGSVISVRERARETATASRMQLILNALTSYDSIDGSSALSLQSHVPLGGVVSFATIRAIDNTITGGSGVQPPPFLYHYYSGGWTSTTLSTGNYLSGINTTESSRFFRRLADDVFDVMPSSVAVATSSNQYITWWPSQWPETDWMNASPGINPPILRFPWGQQGMRIDGSLCDAAIVSGLMVGPTAPSLLEETHSAGYRLAQSEPLANSWATFGAPIASGTQIWSWKPSNPLQTDWVNLTSAIRSDGSTVTGTALGSNMPLPFDLGYLSPLQTILLLQATGTLSAATGANDYRTNRSPSAPWNDAWGNPLIVVYAIFQPERYIRTFDGEDRRDLFLRSAKQNYQYNRAIYFAIGAAGKTLYSNVNLTWSVGNDAVNLQAYWLQIRDVCNAVSWTEASFDSPPWTGIKVGKKNGARSLLSAPAIVK